jgi:hypothetical protein
MKAFKILQVSTGDFIEYNKNQYTHMKSHIFTALIEVDTKLFYMGEEKTLIEMHEIIDQLHDEWFAKKNKTHKQINIPMGVTPFARPRTVWVRR